MKQFSLEKWLKDKSRKVVTRDGRPVRILCTDAKAKDGCCIIAAIETDGEEEGYQFFKDGTAYSSKSSIEDCADLFFADEEEPKKALMMNKEEALQQYEYEKQLFEQWGGTSIITFKEWLEIKSIVLADEEEELTEFEKTMIQFSHERNALIQFEHTTEEINAHLYLYSEKLLDLARKEILKDLPKWKKMPSGIQGNGDFNPTYLVRTSNGHYFTTPCLSWDKDNMYIELSELEKLPKE